MAIFGQLITLAFLFPNVNRIFKERIDMTMIV